MKEISKDEYNVLKNYVPTRVRYFVDAPKRDVVRKANGRAPVNQRVHLTTKNPVYPTGSQIQRIYLTAVKVLNNDPTQIIGRADLAKQIGRQVKDKKPSVFRSVTKLLADGFLAPVAGEK